MDPLIVFDAQRTIPNPFALAVAAAGRARALAPGAAPRLAARPKSRLHLALSEIAGNAFEPREIEPFLLTEPISPKDCARFKSGPRKLCGIGPNRPAAAPALDSRAVH
ncbi:RNA polymerase rpb6 [Mesorhizobium sp. XAP10]|uniref:RNA polymerase rpb6 n=1 Tax=unclassified Mesorhizobium TaxID=325217 RepID=UPI0023DF080E|nr:MULTISPECIES: RNA polymerase rpb6 [unclassified Mesorhizobium]MDF3156603.1 RNA polymerase rpb6 [Mesorhizobium sp. XAP10]MDF3249494.1 RNA polymerase rpb6 [Mesorhizobium sp. XAP4]